MKSGPERGGNASVRDHVLTSQDYREEVEHVKTWLLSSSLTKDPTVLVWMLFSLFFFYPGFKVLLFMLFLGAYVATGCFPMQRLNFPLPKIFNYYLNKTHVYRRSFIFLYFFCNYGVLILQLHVVVFAKFMDHGTTSENYRKVEHVKTGFGSSKFPSVITLRIFFFSV